jgi:hypothetical protein
LQIAKCKLQIINLQFAFCILQSATKCIPSLIVLLSCSVAISQDSLREAPRLDFTRLVAHWVHYDRPDYLEFIRDAEPEVVQVGFYGAHFWSLVHTPQYNGYPSHFPVRGIEECSQWFADLNRKLHKSHVKVIGHFNVEFLVGDPDSPDGPRGFFRFYRDLWDESVLGPKPEEDPIAFLEKKKDGTPIVDRTYAIGGMNEYWACLRNPSWQKVLKAWIRRGIELGVDGYIANYFYRHNCLCEHCVEAFRNYLKARFTPEQLRERFEIDDVARHQFDEIVSWHNPAESTPLRREMLRFSQISNKKVFDEVFVRYGRSIKPDLIVAQWNHLGDFSQIAGDERCMLPGDLWGRDENYLWYSTGGSAYYTDLEQGFLGEATLQCRYIRSAFDDKPFTLGKYEHTRIRAYIAELAANGGAPMGFYSDFTKPEAREILVQYYQFLKRYDEIFRGNRPASEAVLLFPRKAVHAGDLAPLQKLRETGRALLDAHVLFDVLPDDLATPERLAKYAKVLTPEAPPDPWLAEFQSRSRFQALPTVRVSASRPARDEHELDIHFVNYNRTEPPRAADGKPSAGAGAQDEKPIPVTGLRADVLLPPDRAPVSVSAISPEQPEPTPVPFEFADGRLRFTMPEFLVYGIARIRTKLASQSPNAEKPNARRSAPPITHDPNLYLLADDHWIAEQSGLKRIVNRARPLPEPIVWPDDPRTETDFAWGNVIREPDGRFRLWYGTMMMGPNAAGAHEMAKAGVWGRGDDFSFHPRCGDDVREADTMLGKYAESIDGIHWTKPKLGLVEFRGSSDNNIILNGEWAARQTDGLLTNFDGYTILRDDAEPDPTKRYKMVAHWESVHCWDNHEVSGSLGRAKEQLDAYWAARGEYLTSSPDGLRWDQTLERINIPSGGGDRLLVVSDHRHRRWMAYVRAGGWAFPALSYSRDLRDWSPPEPAKHITPASVQAPAVECMIPFNYGNQDFALPCGMDKPRGIFTPMLASRHDGGEWTWIDNIEPFIPFGPPSSYYASGCVPLHNEPIIAGDEMFIYFNAFSRNQSPACPFGTRSIGLATLRRDAFAGLTAADPTKPGTFVTKPISIPGHAIELNVEQRGPNGKVEIAILDEDKQEIPRYRFAEAGAITADAVRHRITWTDGLGLPKDKSVRLALRIHGGAILYAIAIRAQ